METSEAAKIIAILEGVIRDIHTHVEFQVAKNKLQFVVDLMKAIIRNRPD